MSQDCISLLSWAILYNPSIDNWWWNKKQDNLNISFDKLLSYASFSSFWIYMLLLAKLTHVGRWTTNDWIAPNFNSWASTSSSTTWWTSPPNPNVSSHILEKLYSKTWAKATQQDVNTLKCLKEKWQPHFELKRWVWPMIKCCHLTPKSIYSNIGDLVADPSRWSSLVFLLLVLFLLECFFKKTFI